MTKLSCKTIALIIYLCSCHLTFASEALQENNKNKDNLWNAFWNSIVYQFETTTDYWSPIIKEKKQITLDYWRPRLERTADRTVLYIDKNILPKIRHAYAAYMAGPGEQISENFSISYDWFTQNISEAVSIAKVYYKNRYPNQYRYVSEVPAFIKIGYEKFIISIWGILNELEQKDLDKLSGKQKDQLGMALSAAKALKRSEETSEDRFLNQLLDQLRPYVKDLGMKDCYRVTYFQDDIMNAFNLGCNIFISKSLIEELNNDQRLIRAIIAHEIAHGDKGHGIKTMGILLKSGVSHFTELSMQQLVWLATGEVHELFGRVGSGDSHGKLIMERFSPTAPEIEIEADVHAAEILEDAGFSKNDLIDSLKLLHHINGTLDCDQQKMKGGVRHYPTFCARRDAVIDYHLHL